MTLVHHLMCYSMKYHLSIVFVLFFVTVHISRSNGSWIWIVSKKRSAPPDLIYMGKKSVTTSWFFGKVCSWSWGYEKCWNPKNHFVEVGMKLTRRQMCASQLSLQSCPPHQNSLSPHKLWSIKAPVSRKSPKTFLLSPHVGPRYSVCILIIQTVQLPYDPNKSTWIH